MARDIRRLNADLRMTINEYGNDRVYWSEDGSWVKIVDFQLPGNFKTRLSDILILVPENYGYGGCFRDNFLEPDLELLDRDGRTYRKLGGDIHGFRRYPYASMSEEMKNLFVNREWFYLCLHDRNPKSSICNYLMKINLFLGNIYKDWKAIEQYAR